IWYDDDVHDLRSVETEFSAIIFNDELTSEEALSCEPTVSSLNDNEFDFRISFDESDDEDYTGKLVSKNGYDILDMAHPPRDQRHQYLRFEGLEYTDADIMDFKERLGSLLHELILEFFSTFRFREAILDLDTTRRLQFQLGRVRRRISWREFILGMGLHTADEIKSVGFSAYWAESARQIPDKGDLSTYWVGISYAGNFLGPTPSYTSIRDLMLRLCHRYLRMFASGRKRGAMISRGQFVACLAEHFGLLIEERLQGLTVIVRDLHMIDMAEL
ncbi:hypothetical protein Tco_0675205, partial [Tanacetum coccineum]